MSKNIDISALDAYYTKLKKSKEANKKLGKKIKVRSTNGEGDIIIEGLSNESVV